MLPKNNVNFFPPKALLIKIIFIVIDGRIYQSVHTYASLKQWVECILVRLIILIAI